MLVTVGRPSIHDYEYQYDEPQDGFSEEVMEKEVATNEKIKMITEPLNIVATAGDRVELPCRVEKLPNGVVTIWERPSAKHIVSIGDNLIKDDAEEYSIAATDDGNTLIIVAATKKHEGQYKCKIATQESVEVTHIIRVNQPTPHHQALEEHNSSVVRHISFTLIPFTADIGFHVIHLF
eukprot:TRINITY_DN3097_c0_g1_i3.p1 TRINITY_DN3097_c0_g1~~TRINITY_DN3097_c0_g1_i3.p1  ORF type:complete len:179 (-),score=38.78 TRINITY_DN3097_c0_g1_i3:28-564(-)